MKRNAITRIIIYSIVIFILLGILLGGLGYSLLAFHFQSGTESFYETVEGARVDVPMEDIKNIQIEWAAGSIDIHTADTNTISFQETKTARDDQQMVWRIVGKTLIISYTKGKVSFGTFSFAGKDLTVTIPSDWLGNELTLDVASADAVLTDLQVNHVDINTASGNYKFINCTIDNLDADTASGSIYYTGSLNSLDCDAASGSFEGIFTNRPYEIEMDSASGDLDLTLPKGCGFRVSMDTLSGEFDTVLDTRYDGDSYTYGDQHCSISFDGASGKVKVSESTE